MKIGIVVIFSEIEEMEKKIQGVKEQGFDNCQIQSWKPSLWTEKNQQKLKQLTEKYGVTISSFWCGWEGPIVWDFYEGQKTLGLVPPEYREMRIKNLCDGADFAKGLGIKDVVTHMGYIPENPYDEQFEPFCNAVRIVAQHLKENGHDLGKETRIGEGKVDFPKVIAKLHELKYDGYITIEREIEGEQQIVDIRNAKDYLNCLIAEIYGGQA